MGVPRNSTRRAGARPHQVLLLTAADLARVLKPAQALAALARAYRAAGAGAAAEAKSLGFAIDGGTIHVKAGGLPGALSAFVAKTNVNRPGNPVLGLPTVQGLAVLVDPASGRPLAVIDSAALTGIRTAATAVLAATRVLARPPRIVAVIGCGALGAQMVAHLAARFRPREIRVFDRDPARARAFLARAPRGTVLAAGVAEALDGAGFCATCTTATSPVVRHEMLRGPVFLAAVGADNPGKREIDAATMRAAALVADDPGACAAGGEIRHLLAETPGFDAGSVVPLAALVAGRARPPTAPVVVFEFDRQRHAGRGRRLGGYRAAVRRPGVRRIAFAGR